MKRKSVEMVVICLCETYDVIVIRLKEINDFFVQNMSIFGIDGILGDSLQITSIKKYIFGTLLPLNLEFY